MYGTCLCSSISSYYIYYVLYNSDNIFCMGLGDLVEKITTYTGIRWVVYKLSKVFGFDCGCEKRKDSLNKIKFKR